MFQQMCSLVILLLTLVAVGCTSSTTPPTTVPASNRPPVETVATAPPTRVTTSTPSPATQVSATPIPTSTPTVAKIVSVGDLELVIQIPNNGTDRPKFISIPAANAIVNPDGSIGTMTTCGANTKPLPVFGQNATHMRVVDAVPGGKTLDVQIVSNLGTCTMVIQYRRTKDGPYQFFAYYDIEGDDVQAIFLPR